MSNGPGDFLYDFVTGAAFDVKKEVKNAVNNSPPAAQGTPAGNHQSGNGSPPPAIKSAAEQLDETFRRADGTFKRKPKSAAAPASAPSEGENELDDGAADSTLAQS